jgi:hypothetical protein
MNIAISEDVGRLHAGQFRLAELEQIQAGSWEVIKPQIDAADVRFRVDADGRLCFVFWLMIEPYWRLRRGWCGMLFGHAMDMVSPMAFRDVWRWWRRQPFLADMDEMRAWVESSDGRAKRFASALGFRYDAGPCRGILPAGQDADLYLWSRSAGATHDILLQQREKGQRRGAG